MARPSNVHAHRNFVNTTGVLFVTTLYPSTLQLLVLGSCCRRMITWHAVWSKCTDRLYETYRVLFYLGTLVVTSRRYTTTRVGDRLSGLLL